MTQRENSAVITDIILREPFYGSLFLGMNISTSKKVPTMGISYNLESTNIEMYINEDFWNKELTKPDKKQTERLRYGLYKHEILHVVFRHIFRYKDFSRRDVYGIAIDLVVNQYIDNTSSKGTSRFEELPECGVFLSTFPHFDLKPNETVEYYYSRLLEEEAKAKQQQAADKKGDCGSEGEGKGDGKGNGNGDKESDQDGEGKGDEANDDSSLNKSQQNLMNMLGKDPHEMWGEISKLGKDAHDYVEEQFASLIEDRVKKAQQSDKWGTVPANLRDYLEAFIKSRQPTVNWKQILKRFVGFAEQRFNKISNKKESRSFGTNPGIRHKRKTELLVAIDTSGSVDNASLVLFFAELYHIWKAGAQITVVECDTVISNEWKYKGATPVTITGRGGTDFTAPIAYANKKKKFDAIIYFTDGFGAKPAVETKTRVLWFICPTGCTLESLSEFPGRKVKMPTV